MPAGPATNRVHRLSRDALNAQGDDRSLWSTTRQLRCRPQTAAKGHSTKAMIALIGPLLQRSPDLLSERRGRLDGHCADVRHMGPVRAADDAARSPSNHIALDCLI